MAIARNRKPPRSTRLQSPRSEPRPRRAKLHPSLWPRRDPRGLVAGPPTLLQMGRRPALSAGKVTKTYATASRDTPRPSATPNRTS
jgi:hypothetical protein